jgi:hypothetical protein
MRVAHALIMERDLYLGHVDRVYAQLGAHLLAHDAWLDHLPLMLEAAGMSGQNEVIYFAVQVTSLLRSMYTGQRYNEALLVDRLAAGCVMPETDDPPAAADDPPKEPVLVDPTAFFTHIKKVAGLYAPSSPRVVIDACMHAALIRPLPFQKRAGGAAKWARLDNFFNDQLQSYEQKNTPAFAIAKKTINTTKTALISRIDSSSLSTADFLLDWCLDNVGACVKTILCDVRMKRDVRIGWINLLFRVFATMGKSAELYAALVTNVVYFFGVMAVADGAEPDELPVPQGDVRALFKDCKFFATPNSRTMWEEVDCNIWVTPLPLLVKWSPYVSWLIFYTLFGLDVVDAPADNVNIREILKTRIDLDVHSQISDWVRSTGQTEEYIKYMGSEIGTGPEATNRRYLAGWSQRIPAITDPETIRKIMDHVETCLQSPDDRAQTIMLPCLTTEALEYLVVGRKFRLANFPLLVTASRELRRRSYRYFTESKAVDEKFLQYFIEEGVKEENNIALPALCKSMAAMLTVADFDVAVTLIDWAKAHPDFQERGVLMLAVELANILYIEIFDLFFKPAFIDPEKAPAAYSIMELLMQLVTSEVIGMADKTLLDALRKTYRLWPDTTVHKLVVHAKKLYFKFAQHTAAAPSIVTKAKPIALSGGDESETAPSAIGGVVNKFFSFFSVSKEVPERVLLGEKKAREAAAALPNDVDIRQEERARQIKDMQMKKEARRQNRTALARRMPEFRQRLYLIPGAPTPADMNKAPLDEGYGDGAAESDDDGLVEGLSDHRRLIMQAIQTSNAIVRDRRRDRLAKRDEQQQRAARADRNKEGSRKPNPGRSRRSNQPGNGGQ